MLGLRRALLLPRRLPRAWRPPGPRRGGGGQFRLCSTGGKAAMGRRQGPAAAGPYPEESFVFPEYLPEKPSAHVEPPPPAVPAEPEPEPGGSDDDDIPRIPPMPRRPHRVPGQADPSVPWSGVCCSGCGAELHCQDAALAGYLPAEKYRSLVGLPGTAAAAQAGERPEDPPGEEGDEEAVPPEAEQVAANLRALEDALCQRCWLLTHHRQALRVELPAEEYRRRVSAALRSPPRHGRPALVLYMADLLDLPDAVPPDLPELLGARAHLFVLGNKVDLLPADAPGYLKRLRQRLLDACARAGLVDEAGGGGRSGEERRVVNVHLLSARTGYGVEELISKLQASWKFNGDVYLVGSTNSGKSTLFNALLRSDYCKSKASDVIHRATVSTWPGTTLNLLKFPIITPTPYRLFQRNARLQEDAKKTEDDLSLDEQKQLQILKRQGYLVGRVGRTFKKTQVENSEIEFDAEGLSYSIDEEPSVSPRSAPEKVEFTEDEVKYSRWFYDTPGIVRDGCVLNLLNEEEVKLVLPTQAIVPRTFLLKPGMTLFLGSLGRIDYLQGDKASWFTVIASNVLPVHITALEKADALYQKHAGQVLLKVPIGGEERMKNFPPLVPHDVVLEGIGNIEAVADIKLSSAGWVAVTAHLDDKIHLRCYTPEGTKLSVRKPPLLPYIVLIKGNRLKRSPAYKTVKPPSLVQNLKKARARRTSRRWSFLSTSEEGSLKNAGSSGDDHGRTARGGGKKELRRSAPTPGHAHWEGGAAESALKLLAGLRRGRAYEP